MIMNDSDFMSESELISESDAVTDNEATKGHELVLDNEAHDIEGDLPSPIELFSSPDSDWRRTLEPVIKAVVSIHYVHIDAFDTNHPHSGQATGFVVDSEKGYILTNRHVTSSGRFWGYCIFSNREECDVEVVYFDPFHDFAFLHYDTTKVRHASINALVLKPEAAQVGVDVRVVGNDAGEVLSIAPAVISRLDRNPSSYRMWSDYNTHYIQASALAKGGSSGSPVVDIHGFAVALKSGSNRDKGTNFFLPLHRVARALDLLQKGKEISRGTTGTSWRFESLDRCRKLGLSLELEETIRKSASSTNHLLVADTVLPEGPAHGKTQKGDLLLKINGVITTSFVDLEDALDTHVGRRVEFDIRRGDKDLKVELNVESLHASTPTRFVRIARAIFQDVSCQIAMRFAIPSRGVFCPFNGALASLPDGVLVEAVNGRQVDNLEHFVESIQKTSNANEVKLTYRPVTNLHSTSSCFVSLLRCWHPMIESWVRRDDYRQWSMAELDYCKARAVKRSKIGTFPPMNCNTNPAAEYIANTIVKVRCLMRIPLNGESPGSNSDYGIVVDHEMGLVLVSRACVLHEMCKVSLIVAEVEVPARIMFLHPLHNYALLKYDPNLVKAPVASARLSEYPLKLNQRVTMMFVNGHSRNKVAVETLITDIRSLSVPASSMEPHYRAINFEALNVETRLAKHRPFGVIVDSDGSVGGLWLAFRGRPRGSGDKHGLQACHIRDAIEKARDGSLGNPRILDFEMSPRTIVKARKHGVHEKWLREIADAGQGQVLYAVGRLSCRPVTEGIQKDEQLCIDDIIVTLDKKLVTDLSPFSSLYYSDNVNVEVYRNGKKLTLEIPTTSTEHLETSRAIVFCGAVLQPPHHAVRQLMRSLPSEVYVSRRINGTPAQLFNLPSTTFITHVNDVQTPDLDAFVEITNDIPDNTFFRLRTVSIKLRPGVVMMKKCDNYFPMKIYEVPSSEYTGLSIRPQRKRSQAQ